MEMQFSLNCTMSKVQFPIGRRITEGSPMGSSHYQELTHFTPEPTTTPTLPALPKLAAVSGRSEMLSAAPAPTEHTHDNSHPRYRPHRQPRWREDHAHARVARGRPARQMLAVQQEPPLNCQPSTFCRRYAGVIHLQTTALGAEPHDRGWPDTHRPETPQRAELIFGCDLIL